MSKYFTNENLHIITNIISGVQTYGQRYSDQRDWSNYVEAYANTKNEVSITIGWAGNHGQMARKLLQLIQTDYPTDFKNNDKADIATDIKKSFTTKPYYQPKKNSAKGKSIINIISSTGGKKSQDKLFAETIENYLNHAISYGINKDNIKALMMWCEIEHLGGLSPTKRIFGRCGKNPSMDQIMNALKQDQSNGNTAEVGDKIFQSRHDCCYKWINQYAKTQNSTTTTTTKKSLVTTNFSKYYGKISNSGSDEFGSYSGGQAGDQTGREWEIRTWYSRPWNCVLRYPNKEARQLIAELSIQAANNNYIGYDQGQRYTYWECLKNSGYRPSKIKTACEADCSKGVIDNVKAVGYLLNISALKNITSTYTGNMRQGFKNAGFEVLTNQKYLTGYDYLLPGDILLNDEHHTATNLGIGKYATNSNTTPVSNSTLDPAQKFDKNLAGIYTIKASDGLNLRYGAGVNKTLIINIPNNKKVQCYGYYSEVNKIKWLYVQYGSYTGFCSMEYLIKNSSVPLNTSGKLNYTKKATGVVNHPSIYVRKWAGKEYDPLVSVPVIYKDNKIDICDMIKDTKNQNWYFAQVKKDIYGFVMAQYINLI